MKSQILGGLNGEAETTRFLKIFWSGSNIEAVNGRMLPLGLEVSYGSTSAAAMTSRLIA